MREEDSTGCRLFVYGLGSDVVTHEFANATDCMKRQAEIEQHLLGSGYQLAQSSSDRRREHATWRGPIIVGRRVDSLKVFLELVTWRRMI